MISFHDRSGGSYRKNDEVVKGYFCRAQEGLLRPVQLAGKQSEGHIYEIEETWN